VRAELLKHRSTGGTLGLALAMLALLVFVVVIHGFGFEKEGLRSIEDQLNVVFAWGDVLSALFGALLGAMSLTTEIRHGTIRPTFLVTPRRSVVMLAKAETTMLLALAFGLIAGGLAAGLGTWVFSARDIPNQLGTGDLVLLLVGSAGSGALWAAIGLGLGAIFRHQVPVVVGLTTWLLLIENLLVGYAEDVGRLLPGAAAMATAGLNPDVLLAPAAGAAVLIAYAVVLAGAGWLATTRRDVA
jgi:ABC-2 type transport system permease protein